MTASDAGAGSVFVTYTNLDDGSVLELRVQNEAASFGEEQESLRQVSPSNKPAITTVIHIHRQKEPGASASVGQVPDPSYSLRIEAKAIF